MDAIDRRGIHASATESRHNQVTLASTTVTILGIVKEKTNIIPSYSMPDNLSLLSQIARRAKTFHANTGISQNQLVSAIGLTSGNYSAFLSGQKGIGSESLASLLQVMSMFKRLVIALFNTKSLPSRILKLQEQGTKKALRFDTATAEFRTIDRFDSNSGWVAAERNSAADPVNSGGDITNVPKASTQQVADLVAVFKQLDYMTRKGVIDSFLKAHAAANTVPTSQKFSRKR